MRPSLTAIDLDVATTSFGHCRFVTSDRPLRPGAEHQVAGLEVEDAAEDDRGVEDGNDCTVLADAKIIAVGIVVEVEIVEQLLAGGAVEVVDVIGAAIRGVEDEIIPPRAAEEVVVAPATVQHVVAVAAPEVVIAPAAIEQVIARLAPQPIAALVAQDPVAAIAAPEQVVAAAAVE